MPTVVVDEDAGPEPIDWPDSGYVRVEGEVDLTEEF